MIKASAIVAITICISACGALETKRFPDEKSLAGELFPGNTKGINERRISSQVSRLLERKSADGTGLAPGIFSEKGKIFLINTIQQSATEDLDKFAGLLEKASNITGVSRLNMPSTPDLKTLRLLSAEHGARYAVIVSEFSNEYQYHNAWTIPSVLGLGIPYFFLDTQTLLCFSKLEITIVDVERNIMLLNESATAHSESSSKIQDAGLAGFQLKQQTIRQGMNTLQQKLTHYL